MKAHQVTRDDFVDFEPTVVFASSTRGTLKRLQAVLIVNTTGTVEVLFQVFREQTRVFNTVDFDSAIEAYNSIGA